MLLCGSVLWVGQAGASTSEPEVISGGLLERALSVTRPASDLLEVVNAGWDDDAATQPVPLSTVNAAIGADHLWARGHDGSGVGVALVDTGVVPVLGLDLPGKIVNGPDLSFESGDADVRHLDSYGHGTHMAGIIAGSDGVADGFRGVAPGAHLVSLKVASHEGAVDVSQVVAAIDWVVQHRDDPGLNIRVLNLSFGSDGTQSYQTDPITHAVEVAWRAGIVVVAGGGNDGVDRPMLTNPAVDPYVIAVGADDLRATASSLDDRVAPFSSRGSETRAVDLVAPGVSLASLRDPGSTVDRQHPSAVVDGRYFRGSGTSQASAVTAGAVALLIDARPELSPDQVKGLLMQTATPLLSLERRATGSGRIDVNLASVAPLPVTRQDWPRSTGRGSLEQARGSAHVADRGVELVGEQDIMGAAWDGAAWAAASSSGTAWQGGRWNGSVWTGDCWCAKTWAGSSWSAAKWRTGWTGRTWVGRTWVGRTWVGRTWVEDSWPEGS